MEMDTPDTRPQAQTPPAQDLPTQSDLEQRLLDLQLRERALKAREALLALRLPQDLTDLMDLNSDEGLQKSLRLARSLQKQAQVQAPPGDAPKAHVDSPLDVALMGYPERAALYQHNPAIYNQTFGGK